LRATRPGKGISGSRRAGGAAPSAATTATAARMRGGMRASGGEAGAGAPSFLTSHEAVLFGAVVLWKTAGAAGAILAGFCVRRGAGVYYGSRDGAPIPRPQTRIPSLLERHP